MATHKVTRINRQKFWFCLNIYSFAFINISDPMPMFYLILCCCACIAQNMACWHSNPMSQVSNRRSTKEWKERMKEIWYSSVFCMKKFMLQSSHVAQNAFGRVALPKPTCTTSLMNSLILPLVLLLLLCQSSIAADIWRSCSDAVRFKSFIYVTETVNW